MPEFKLLPSQSELSKLANDYWETSSEKDKKEEREAFEAGAAIKNGDRSIATLKKIVYWKSPRIVHHLTANNSDQVKKALDIAVNHTDTSVALGALKKLKGVAIPVASAILTTIHPDRYTIIDFRVLEALGHFEHDEQFYVSYLQFCVELSKRKDLIEAQSDTPGATTLRALDRALWQWSATKSEEEKKALAYQ